MPTTLTDSRTVARLNPDALMEEIADREIAIAKANARYEAKVKAVKDEYEAAVAADRAALETAKTQLGAWIEANRDEFKRPRARTNAYGKYGLRTVSNLRITDGEALENELCKREYSDCIKLEFILVKPAIKKRLQEGEALPGAELEQGERAFCEVAKALLDQARQEA
jgi:phage host-nuclease inhibitor protein Gam